MIGPTRSGTLKASRFQDGPTPSLLTAAPAATIETAAAAPPFLSAASSRRRVACDLHKRCAADRVGGNAGGFRLGLGLVQRGQRSSGARRRPQPQLLLEAIDELEEKRRAKPKRLVFARARGKPRAGEVEPLEMAQLRAKHRHGLRAFAEGAIER